jgi:phosphoribosyl 1,2-cyclic phosphate phosphodiesterase
MPAIRITFLGTGTSSGVPMVACDCRVCRSVDPLDKRLRSSLLVQSGSTTVVVDATPDFRQQMLLHGIRHLDGIVLTHEHKDHVGGLDDTRGFQFFQNAPTRIYGLRRSLDGVMREVPYAFEETRYPGVPVFDLEEIGNEPFEIGDIRIVPIMVMHYKMPVLGFRFNDFTYITDANFIHEQEKSKIRGSHILVLNALRKEKHLSHFTLDEAVKLVKELEVPEAYFTHISHQLGLHEEINAELPAGMQLAYDGLHLSV